MFTVCPKCTLSLAVAAADLRVGQGYVRCGRCSNVFNALLALSEEPPIDLTSTRPHAALQVPPPEDFNDSDYTDTIADDPEEPADPNAESGVQLQLDEAIPEEVLAAHDDEAEVVESHGTGTFETIVLEGEGILQTEEFVTEDDMDHELAQVAHQLASDDHEGDGHGTPDDAPIADSMSGFTAPARAAPEPYGQTRWPWVAGTALLALLLLAQVIHHWRNDLAARPVWYEPLTAIYQKLGLTLTPAWSLGAYDVRQLGASADSDGGNAIRIRVSVANRATRAQPMPLLRLTLLDRYGKRLAARNLSPAEYLPPNSADARFMTAGQRVDSTIAVADPGDTAASFELDVCLPAAGNALRCAGDEPVFDSR